jgi:DNA-binding HxlR family transcriptional regulator
MKTENLRNILSDFPEGIAEMLRSASHPARIRVLTLLLRGEHKFSRLQRSTSLSKTALANHLDQLVDRKLVDRIDRGEYDLTVFGRRLIEAVATIYSDSALREREEQRRLSRRYAEGLSERISSDRKVISKKIEHVSRWLSYTSAMAASLKALGVPVDATDVGGYSGYSFLVNVAKGILSPSGPTALSMGAWKELIRGTESLGWTLERCKYPHSYPTREGSPTPKEMEVARRLFGKIKKEIDEKDRPVVLWGTFVPVYGVVNGYEGESYITSEFRDGRNVEKLLPFHDLKAPGHIDAFFFRNKIARDRGKESVVALGRAVAFAAARVPILDGYVAGPRALDEWADTLANSGQGDQDYMGNSYVGMCVAEGRSMCSDFLKRLINQFHWNHSEDLRKAAEHYQESAKLMEEFTEIFPFKYQGKMNLKDRRRGAEILRNVGVKEQEAVKQMDEVLDIAL